jgi:hypothetical protein
MKEIVTYYCGPDIGRTFTDYVALDDWGASTSIGAALVRADERPDPA